MKVFFYFAVIGFSNTYLIGPDEGGDAVIVDPGVMDVDLLKLIENNDFYIRSVLVTNTHEAHINGLKTLFRIYDFTLYGGAKDVLDYPCRQIGDGEKIDLSGIEVTAYNVSGHSKDSMVYKIGDMLFSGDAVGAGRLGDSPNNYAKAILKHTITEKIGPMDPVTHIFPGHGPPSTLRVEKQFNPAFIDSIH